MDVANTRALAVGFEGSKNADHFFPSKRHGGFVRNFRGFQFSCRVIVNPFSLFCEPQECTEPLELLETGTRAIFPRCPENRERVQVQLLEKLQLVCFRETIKLSKKQAVFVQRRFVQLPRLCVSHEFHMSILDRDLFFLLNCAALFRFPLAD